jgi:hypothetical protein
VIISLLLFTDKLVSLASTPEGLQRQINPLASFCDLRQLVLNLGKTKLLIFNALKSSLIAYTYLGVQFKLHGASFWYGEGPSASAQ